jgi:hypothetical protein
MKAIAGSSFGRPHTGVFRSTGIALSTASRTMRRCIPNFLAIPRIVPSPCSYSRRICSNSSTLALLSTRPPLGRLSPKRSTRYMAFSKGGPNQSIEWGQIRVSKSPRASCRGSATSWPFVDDVCCRLRMDCISDGRDALASIDSRRSAQRTREAV